MNDAVIACTDLKKFYHDGRKELQVLSGIDFIMPAKKTVAILGTSGSGKSTFLHLLGGLDKPTTGKIFWHDCDINKIGEKKKCKLRNSHLGFIYQFHHLLPEFTALENVALPLLIAGVKTYVAKARAKEILTAVGLDARLKHKPSELSGGEKQRVAIARALITKPKCILADEPTGNLDKNTASAIVDLMLSLHATFAISFIVVTHDLELAKKMDEFYFLQNGLLFQPTMDI